MKRELSLTCYHNPIPEFDLIKELIITLSSLKKITSQKDTALLLKIQSVHSPLKGTTYAPVPPQFN